MKELTVNDVLDNYNKEAGNVEELSKLIKKFNSTVNEKEKDIIFDEIESLMDQLNDRMNTSNVNLFNGRTTLRYEFGNVHSCKYRGC